MDPKEYKDIVYRIIGTAMEVHNELKWELCNRFITRHCVRW